MPVVTEKLVTPPVVKKYVSNRTDLGTEGQAGVERNLTLSYLYGGKEVMCRGEGDEFEVVFVGTSAELGEWLDTSADLLKEVYLERPYPWPTAKREWGISD